MTDADADFWTCENEYHELARQYEQHVTVEHPTAVSGHCPFCYHCTWCVTAVTYPKYEGPAVTAL